MKLNEAYDTLVSGAIFNDLSSLEVPWSHDADTANQLDLAYIYNHSGKKVASNLVEGLCVDGKLTITNRQLLAKTAYTMYGNNWSNLWKVHTADYDPIENYHMTEEENTTANTSTEAQNQGTLTRSDDTDSTMNGTNGNTRTDNLTQSTENDVTTDNYIYGFNSSSASNSDKSVTANDSTIKNTGTVTDAGNSSSTSKIENDISESSTDNTTATTESEADRKLERYGNIGVQTSQDMIMKSTDLYANWDFFNQVFKDLDKLLTCGFWEV